MSSSYLSLGFDRRRIYNYTTNFGAVYLLLIDIGFINLIIFLQRCGNYEAEASEKSCRKSRGRRVIGKKEEVKEKI